MCGCFDFDGCYDCVVGVGLDFLCRVVLVVC